MIDLFHPFKFWILKNNCGRLECFRTWGLSGLNLVLKKNLHVNFVTDLLNLNKNYYNMVVVKEEKL